MSWFHTVKTTNNQDYYHFEKYQTSKAAEINTRRVGCATLGHPRTTELKFGIILRPTRRALLSSDTVIDATTLCPPRWWTADTDVVVWQKKRTTDWSRSSVCSLFSSWSARARVSFLFSWSSCNVRVINFVHLKLIWFLFQKVFQPAFCLFQHFWKEKFYIWR